MYVLYPRDELVGEEQDGLQAEPPRTEVEEVLEAGTEQFHDHHVEVPFGSAPFDGRNSNATLYHRFGMRITHINVNERDLCAM